MTQLFHYELPEWQLVAAQTGQRECEAGCDVQPRTVGAGECTLICGWTRKQ